MSIPIFKFSISTDAATGSSYRFLAASYKYTKTPIQAVPTFLQHFTLFNFFSQTAIISFCKEVIPDFRHFPTSAFNFSTLESPSM